MKTARILLVSVFGICMVVSFFIETPTDYTGTYLHPADESPLFYLRKNGTGTIYQPLANGFTTGRIKWRHNASEGVVELHQQGKEAIKVVLVRSAIEQGQPISGNPDDLLLMAEKEGRYTLQHFASRIDMDSLTLRPQAASVKRIF